MQRGLLSNVTELMHPRFSRTKIADFTQRLAPEDMQFTLNFTEHGQIHAKFHGTWPNSR